MEFESANPSIVKAIKQRDLLNTWLRLYARDQRMPGIEEYQPARLEEELPDLVFYTVDTARLPPRLTMVASFHGGLWSCRTQNACFSPRRLRWL